MEREGKAKCRHCCLGDLIVNRTMSLGVFMQYCMNSCVKRTVGVREWEWGVWLNEGKLYPSPFLPHPLPGTTLTCAVELPFCLFPMSKKRDGANR